MLLTLGIFNVCVPNKVENFVMLNEEMKFEKLKNILLMKKENFIDPPISNKLSSLETKMKEMLADIQDLKISTHSPIPKNIEEEANIIEEENNEHEETKDDDDSDDESEDVEGFIEGCTNNCGLI